MRCNTSVVPAPAPLPLAGELLQKLLSVTKPSGHLSHIHNAGSDDAVLDAAKEAHAAGKGPSVGTLLVTPNGQQLQEVSACELGRRARGNLANLHGRLRHPWLGGGAANQPGNACSRPELEVLRPVLLSCCSHSPVRTVALPRRLPTSSPPAR